MFQWLTSMITGTGEKRDEELEKIVIRRKIRQ